MTHVTNPDHITIHLIKLTAICEPKAALFVNILDLFNDSVGNADCIESNYRIINE